MPKGIEMKLLLMAFVLAIMTGCAAPPYEQKIQGVMLKDGAPVANVKVWFQSEYPEDTCEGPGLETTTDELGKFEFKQLYTPSKMEKYAVLIHPYRLCMSIGEQRKIIWKRTTGPAPVRIDFRCELNEKGDAVCKVAWDGQEFR